MYKFGGYPQIRFASPKFAKPTSFPNYLFPNNKSFSQNFVQKTNKNHRPFGIVVLRVTRNITEYDKILGSIPRRGKRYQCMAFFFFFLFFLFLGNGGWVMVMCKGVADLFQLCRRNLNNSNECHDMKSLNQDVVGAGFGIYRHS